MNLVGLWVPCVSYLAKQPVWIRLRWYDINLCITGLKWPILVKCVSLNHYKLTVELRSGQTVYVFFAYVLEMKQRRYGTRPVAWLSWTLTALPWTCGTGSALGQLLCWLSQEQAQPSPAVLQRLEHAPAVLAYGTHWTGLGSPVELSNRKCRFFRRRTWTRTDARNSHSPSASRTRLLRPNP